MPKTPAVRDPGRERVISFKHRIIEVGLTALFSSVTAAISVTWSVSATFSHLRDKVDGIELRITDDERRLNEDGHANNQQDTQIAVQQAINNDIVRRLTSIETKIDVQSARLGK